MISLAIILVGVLGSIYFRFFFDNRFFLKNETKEVVSLLSDINAGEEFELSSFTEADSIFVVGILWLSDKLQRVAILEALNTIFPPLILRSDDHCIFWEIL